ncbi:hypothetical protein BSG1_09383 [Bacillus sp. SG-1]|nr:hypothetical protein BSG1_09383 [Bacillus sp. SG-1]
MTFLGNDVEICKFNHFLMFVGNFLTLWGAKSDASSFFITIEQKHSNIYLLVGAKQGASKGPGYVPGGWNSCAEARREKNKLNSYR